MFRKKVQTRKKKHKRRGTKEQKRRIGGNLRLSKKKKHTASEAQAGGMGEKSIDLVISRYKESLSWLTPYLGQKFRKVIIYNKDESGTSFKCPVFTQAACEVRNIPNVGVCDHTYLYHIINSWDALADVTIFLPGSADMDNKKSIMKTTIENALKTENTVLNIYEFDVNIDEAMYNFVMENHQTAYANNRKEGSETKQILADVRPFGAWYAANFPGEYYKEATFLGIHAMSKEHIKKRAKAFYETFINQINKGKFHEAAHYIERCYRAMLYTAPKECLYKSPIINFIVEDMSKGYLYLRRKR